MKQIYKVLISILVISMLAVTAISAVTGPYTGCVSKSATKYDIKGIFYYFQSGSTPMSPCKIGDDQITIYEKTYIDNVLNNLQTQINNIGSEISLLTNRVTNIENDPYPAIYSLEAFDIKHYGGFRHIPDGGTQSFAQIVNFTYELPRSGYVNIEASGQYENTNMSNKSTFDVFLNFDQYIQIDNQDLRFSRRIYTCAKDNSCFSGFQTNLEKYQTKGNYTIYLFGSPGNYPHVTITVTSMSEGNLTHKFANDYQ